METWWQQTEALERFVGDLVAGELTRLRPGCVLPVRPWPHGQSLVEGEIACDSLELLNVATALSEALEMHRAGLEDYLLARRTLAEWVEIAAASLDRYSGRLAFRTSGSTGAPKTVHHALASLIEEVEALAAIIPARRRVISAVPSHHIYGFLFTVLLPQRLGTDVIDVRSQSPAGVRARLRGGDLVVAHPAFWSAFVRAGDSVPSDVLGVTSTAPCPPETAKSVASCGIARLLEIYGCSETAGVGWRDKPDTDFHLFPHWKPGLEPSSLLRSPGNDLPKAQLPDRVAWTGERTFRVEGRFDQAVQVGGINVFPCVVRDKLLEHPEVRDAVVRLMRPSEGARLKAFIVPREPKNLHDLRRQLAGWCDARLSAPERPKAFAFGPSLPSGALGKAADWPLNPPGPAGFD